MSIKRFVVGSVMTNCYLFKSLKDLIIIDPGGDCEMMLDEIEKHNKGLKYIICTHYHFDHTWKIDKIKRKYPNAEVLIHEKEKPYLKHFFNGIEIILGEPSKKRASISEDCFVNIKVDRFLYDGSQISVGDQKLNVVLTPGHTPGSICLLGNDFIFTGDTLFNGGYGRTDLCGGSEVELEKSLRKLDKIIKSGMKVYPGHGEIFISQ